MIGVIGAAGKMGQEIARILAAQGLAFKPVTRVQISASQNLSLTSLIDFSVASSVDQVKNFAVQFGLPTVSGTTGADVERAWREASGQIPVLWSSNMSLGVAVLKKSLSVLRSLESQTFDFQIEEIHHTQKKDSPSGTALSLQKKLDQVLSPAQKDHLHPIQALRLGGVYGIHKVYAISQDESLTFEHQALNRSVFAQGAVTAALWLQNKPKGFYTLEDLLSV